ncbi:histo-blood group ABO system transferase isoform X1 [Hylobates moloch]|uniref:histo-blood group ABO system transferase isoform X1 n=2 Tax=Hylobates moloch TaxID=81572 RepID=UPI002674F381|nr:histo-blood group ABO system transferase isoform X1 [Hylobates moloch]
MSGGRPRPGDRVSRVPRGRGFRGNRSRSAPGGMQGQGPRGPGLRGARGSHGGAREEAPSLPSRGPWGPPAASCAPLSPPVFGLGKSGRRAARAGRGRLGLTPPQGGRAEGGGRDQTRSYGRAAADAGRMAVREPDRLQRVSLPRMAYPQPKVLTPCREDVLVVTPWLAPIVWEGTFNIDILNEQFRLQNTTIGLTVFAIKKYVAFLKLFLETAEKHFMVGHRVHYYVFTDQPAAVPRVTLGTGRRLSVLEVRAHKRWQDVSMRRMEMISDFCERRFLSEVDYLVCADVDMEFRDHVGVEILTPLFGTLHPSFYGSSREAFTYERRPQSQAYIPKDEGDFYYMGAFFGGSVREVQRLTRACHQAMMVDQANGIEAVWHDESHLNKYLLRHKPTKVLSPEYLWDQQLLGWPAVLRKLRFTAVPKNHQAIRNP